MKSVDKIYYYHIGSSWHEQAYIPQEYENKDSSWLYKKINDPSQGSVDFTNSHAIKRIFPIPKEMCTWKLLEIQKDYKKARNLL
jgi:hypothetical protein